ncbi:recombinase family protein [Streptomyces albipurpureus]|uniref:Recombinase family protein n=1 Tax=Streptomyces albipurpureus TaxID=2897419 RepID=A0ABT0UPE2_9ACTN|nr:recombinase family protein [Streptomyces sp. CWNU-1]MCM2390211.1 recombinase family protein [Streptomyces sp. CWNU-1]
MSTDSAHQTHGEVTHAFIYDRHATLNTVALDDRLKRCREYAQEHGYRVAGMWLDLGDHALGHHRPEFQNLCRAMAGTSGRVICLVHDWDRLSRDASQSAVMRRCIEHAGGYSETADGETDEPLERLRGLLTTPD